MWRLTVLLAITALTAQAQTPARAPVDGPSIVEPGPAIYASPRRGAPDGRQSGATRGAPKLLPRLVALAPEAGGFTREEQPTLYWFISGRTDLPVRITLTREDREQPLIEVEFPSPVAAGVHAYPIARSGIKLALGVLHEWTVSIIADQRSPSLDASAKATIRRVAPPGSLGTRELAAAGFWYDAFDAVSRRGLDRSAAEERTLLLDMVSLREGAMPEPAAKPR